MDLCGNCLLEADPDFNTLCADCRGVPNGGFAIDPCGACKDPTNSSRPGGFGQGCSGCDGVSNSGSQIDVCGMCRLPSDDSPLPCLDCFGVAKGNATLDQCGVCGGDGTSCLDCAGEVFGPLRIDECGDCLDPESDEFNEACRDCSGEINGGRVFDRCNVCDGNGDTCVLPTEAIVLGVVGGLILCLGCCAFLLTLFRRRENDEDDNTPLGARVRSGKGRKVFLQKKRGSASASAQTQIKGSARGGASQGTLRQRGPGGDAAAAAAEADLDAALFDAAFGEGGSDENAPLLR